MAVTSQALDVVEGAERQEIVRPTPEVLAPLAGADEDAHTGTHGGLGDLYYGGVSVPVIPCDHNESMNFMGWPCAAFETSSHASQVAMRSA